MIGQVCLKCHLSRDGRGLPRWWAQGSTCSAVGGWVASALRRACCPQPTPTALQASSLQEGGGRPRPQARGVGPHAEPGQGSETRCLPPSTIFVCSVKGGGQWKERGELRGGGDSDGVGWGGRSGKRQLDKRLDRHAETHPQRQRETQRQRSRAEWGEVERGRVQRERR